MAMLHDPLNTFSPADPAKVLSFPVGAASPLWFAFGAAALSVSAWWWMTQWARDASAPATASPPSRAPEQDGPEIPEAVAVAEAASLVIDPVIDAPVAVASEPAPLPSATAAMQAAKTIADDLTRLIGVGPKLAAALAERGVTRFEQIAAWQAKDLDEVDKALNLKGRATRDAWVSQARRLAGAWNPRSSAAGGIASSQGMGGPTMRMGIPTGLVGLSMAIGLAACQTSPTPIPPVGLNQASPSEAARRVVGAWALNARECESDNGLVYKADGSWFSYAAFGTWSLSGDRLTRVITHRGAQLGEERAVVPPERDVVTLVSVSPSRLETRGTDGAAHALVRCPNLPGG